MTNGHRKVHFKHGTSKWSDAKDRTVSIFSTKDLARMLTVLATIGRSIYTLAPGRQSHHSLKVYKVFEILYVRTGKDSDPPGIGK